MSDPGGRLDTWKQIGDYLGQKNERTARRWAAERGLPVHRVPGGKRASVYALKSEIEPPKTQAARRWSRPVLWAGVSMLALIGAVADARSFESRETSPPLALTKVTYLTNDGLEKTGQWIAYIRRGGRTLWRSRADGSDALQLAKTSVAAELPRWPPDGSRIAFTAVMPGRPERIFLVPRDGGAAQEAVPGNDDQGAPTWSPDGRPIAYGNLYCGENHGCAIHVARLADGQVETLPGSQGLRTARWSPDGRWIAALATGTRQIRIFDLRGRHRRTLARGSYADNLAWSRDSTSLYAGPYDDPDPKILRIRLADGERTPAVRLASLRAKFTDLEPWFGLHRASEIVRAGVL